MDDFKRKLIRILHYLVSHHSEAYYDRTITIRMKGRELHICARCSAIVSSFIISAIIFFYLRLLFNFFINPLIALILAVIFVIPTMVDWASQKLEFRESKNVIRMSLGVFLGIAFTLLQFALLLYPITNIVVLTGFLIFFGISIYQNHRKYKISSKKD